MHLGSELPLPASLLAAPSQPLRSPTFPGKSAVKREHAAAKSSMRVRPQRLDDSRTPSSSSIDRTGALPSTVAATGGSNRGDDLKIHRIWLHFHPNHGHNWWIFSSFFFQAFL
jgi:hypothetical protein